MKKLMFAAAVAASSMAFAAPEAQVYDVTLSIKTTAAATAKLNNKQNPLAVDDDSTRSVIYRKQASTTWKGLIWGCNCESINGVWEFVKTCQGDDNDTIKGCILWDAKKNPVFLGDGSDLTDPSSVPGTGFGWNFINAINKDGKQVEGTWTMIENGLSCDDSAVIFDFYGAGFGTVNLKTTKDDDGILYPACESYIKSMSGNFAGYMRAPNADKTTQEWAGCTFCGYDSEEKECVLAEAWTWCVWNNDCQCDLAVGDPLMTAAYGTWKIAYNSSLSKKLSTPAEKKQYYSIRDVYNFSDSCAAAIYAVESVIWGIRPDGCDELEAALDAAKADYADAKAKNDLKIKDVEDAQANFDAVKTESLTNAIAQARAAEEPAKEAAYVATTNWNEKVKLETTANSTLAVAQLVYTNTAIVVQLFAADTHGSTGDATLNVKGYDKLMGQIPELGAWAKISVSTNSEIAIAKSVFNADTRAAIQALVDDANTAVVNADAAATSAKQAAATALSKKEEAYLEMDKKRDAEIAAEARYEDRVSLQLQADQELRRAEDAQLITAAALEVASAKLAKAQKAYDDADCE